MPQRAESGKLRRLERISAKRNACRHGVRALSRNDAREYLGGMTHLLRCIGLVCCGLVAAIDAAAAAGCNFEPQGEGRVSAVIDNRSFRLEDGREVRLAGLAPVPTGTTALTALIAGRDVRLRG